MKPGLILLALLMAISDETHCDTCGVVFKNPGLLALHKKRYGNMCYLNVAPNQISSVEAMPERPQTTHVQAHENEPQPQPDYDEQPNIMEPEHNTDAEQADDEYQEKIRFHTLVQLLNNDQGASESDIAHIIHYIKYLVDSGKRPPFDNVTQLKAFREQLLKDMGDGWTKSAIVVDKFDIPTLPSDFKFETEFHHMDMMLWLDSQFGNMEYQDNFVLRAAKKYNIHGERYACQVM